MSFDSETLVPQGSTTLLEVTFSICESGVRTSEVDGGRGTLLRDISMVVPSADYLTSELYTWYTTYVCRYFFPGQGFENNIIAEGVPEKEKTTRHTSRAQNEQPTGALSSQGEMR